MHYGRHPETVHLWCRVAVACLRQRNGRLSENCGPERLVFLDGGWPLNERRRQAYAAGTQSRRTAPDETGPQACPELGPPIIVTFHDL
jgi:hypothetical protein